MKRQRWMSTMMDAPRVEMLGYHLHSTAQCPLPTARTAGHHNYFLSLLPANRADSVDKFRSTVHNIAEKKAKRRKDDYVMCNQSIRRILGSSCSSKPEERYQTPKRSLCISVVMHYAPPYHVQCQIQAINDSQRQYCPNAQIT